MLEKTQSAFLAPGSKEAGKAGCVCPILDNAHGRGYMGGAIDKKSGKPVFVTFPDACPIHTREVMEAYYA